MGTVESLRDRRWSFLQRHRFGYPVSNTALSVAFFGKLGQPPGTTPLFWTTPVNYVWCKSWVAATALFTIYSVNIS